MCLRSDIGLPHTTYLPASPQRVKPSSPSPSREPPHHTPVSGYSLNAWWMLLYCPWYAVVWYRTLTTSNGWPTMRPAAPAVSVCVSVCGVMQRRCSRGGHDAASPDAGRGGRWVREGWSAPLHTFPLRSFRSTLPSLRGLRRACQLAEYRHPPSSGAGPDPASRPSPPRPRRTHQQ